MSEFHAAIGLSVLDDFDGVVRRRQIVAKRQIRRMADRRPWHQDNESTTQDFCLSSAASTSARVPAASRGELALVAAIS
jgi:hypothetical protein